MKISAASATVAGDIREVRTWAQLVYPPLHAEKKKILGGVATFSAVIQGNDEGQLTQ